MEHWQVPYLGIRQIPNELNEFELNTFFTFSSKERALIDARRHTLYRLAVALHIGFLRMAGRTLDAYNQIPKILWTYLGAQLGVIPPEVSTLRALYQTRPRTLTDHQMLAYQALGFQPMTEHQRRYVSRWLKETLPGRSNISTLLGDLKRWLYEHKILIAHDRELKRLIARAITIHEDELEKKLLSKIGEKTIALWSQELGNHVIDQEKLQHWLWSVPLRNSTVQMGELFSKMERLYSLQVHTNWPAEINETTLRYYARRCAGRPPSISKRIKTQSRRLETACFMRYALCTATDHLLVMLRGWLQKVTNEAASQVASARPDLVKKMQEFADDVRALANDEDLSHEDLRTRLCELADNALKNKLPSRSSLIRLHLMIKSGQSRAILAKLVLLPF